MTSEEFEKLVKVLENIELTQEDVIKIQKSLDTVADNYERQCKEYAMTNEILNRGIGIL